jgi:hypothetical protein
MAKKADTTVAKVPVAETPVEGGEA